jgi:hypothetical protein
MKAMTHNSTFHRISEPHSEQKKGTKAAIPERFFDVDVTESQHR